MSASFLAAVALRVEPRIMAASSWSGDALATLATVQQAVRAAPSPAGVLAALQQSWPDAALLIRWEAHGALGRVFGEGFDFWCELQRGDLQLVCVYIQWRRDFAEPEAARTQDGMVVDGATLLEMAGTLSATDIQQVVSTVKQVAESSSERTRQAPAAAAYYALAAHLGLARPMLIFWRASDSVPTVSSSSAAATWVRLVVLATGGASVEVLLFETPVATAAAAALAATPTRILLAPTCAGKSTARALAPAHVAEGELLAHTAFRWAYTKPPLPRADDAWLAESDGLAETFDRNLALVARWINADARRLITFNCCGSALSRALFTGTLHPSQVAVVLPPESQHRRNVAARGASGLCQQASISQWDSGPGLNREQLYAAAFEHGLALHSSFSAALPFATRLFVSLRRVSPDGSAAPGPRLSQPPRKELLGCRGKPCTMLHGRVVDYLDAGGAVETLATEEGMVATEEGMVETEEGMVATEEGMVATEEGMMTRAGTAPDERAVWMLCAAAAAPDALVLKSYDGFVLACGGEQLVSAEDCAAPDYWEKVESADGDSADAFELVSRCGKGGGVRCVLHATRLRGLATAANGAACGPWLHQLPIDRMVAPASPRDAGGSDEASSGLTPVILWYTGSFAPFHQGHLDCVSAARQALLARGQHVLGAYVHAHPEHTLAYKRVEGHAAALQHTRHRLALVACFLDGIEWGMLDSLNATRGQGSNHEALFSLRERMAAAFAHAAEHGAAVASTARAAEEASVVWVVGSDSFPDLWEKVRPSGNWQNGEWLEHARAQRIQLCVVHNRPSQRVPVPPEALALGVIEIDAPEALCGDRSATAVRAAFEADASAAQLEEVVGSRAAAAYLRRMRAQGS